MDVCASSGAAAGCNAPRSTPRRAEPAASATFLLAFVYALFDLVFNRSTVTFESLARAGTSTIPETQPAPPPSNERWQVLLTRPIGHVVTAAHMTWGATNELLTMTGYRELLLRIAAQESRHYSFYRLQAEFRLEESRLARVVLMRLMKRAWTPVGVGDGFKSRAEFDRVLQHLAGDGRGQAAVRKGVFTRLPGFSDVRIYAAAARTRLAA